MLHEKVPWSYIKFERSKIVFNARDASNIQEGETFCTCGSMQQGITEEVKKQAEQ